MKNKRTKLLDCTLRDGGYVNNWNFGLDNIKTIIPNPREVIRESFIILSTEAFLSI